MKATLKKALFYSLANDGNTDVKNVAKVAVFVRGVDGHSRMTEQLAALIPMQGITNGENLTAVKTCMKELFFLFRTLKRPYD